MLILDSDGDRWNQWLVVLGLGSAERWPLSSPNTEQPLGSQYERTSLCTLKKMPQSSVKRIGGDLGNILFVSQVNPCPSITYVVVIMSLLTSMRPKSMKLDQHLENYNLISPATPNAHRVLVRLPLALSDVDTANGI